MLSHFYVGYSTSSYIIVGSEVINGRSYNPDFLHFLDGGSNMVISVFSCSSTVGTRAVFVLDLSFGKQHVDNVSFDTQ